MEIVQNYISDIKIECCKNMCDLALIWVLEFNKLLYCFCFIMLRYRICIYRPIINFIISVSWWRLWKSLVFNEGIMFYQHLNVSCTMKIWRKTSKEKYYWSSRVHVSERCLIDYLNLSDYIFNDRNEHISIVRIDIRIFHTYMKINIIT
jgi:hypothetical protein